MANTKLNMQLLLRRDQVFTSTYVLAAGEPGFEISTNTLKVGDGTKTWAELPFANKEQVEAILEAYYTAEEVDALIKAVDDKVAALNDTYATDAEVEGIRAALQAAIDTKLAAETFNNYSATRQLTDTEINTAIGNVDAKFASYRTSADQDGIDGEQDRRLGLIETELGTHGDIVTHNVSEFATAEQGAKADAAAVKADVDAALEARYTKTEADGKFETIANVDLVRTDVTNITKEGGLIDTAKSDIIGTAEDAAVANTIYGAKKYAKDLVDAIPGQIDYTVTCADEEFDATDSAPAFKRHTLTQNGNTVCTIDVPRDLVLKSGYVDGEKDELVLVLVNDEEIRVDVSHLIEYVTGGTAADGVITINVDDNFVTTATINDGTITSAKFADEVDTYVDGRIDNKIGTYNTTTVAPIAKAVEDNKAAYDAYVIANDARVKAVEDDIAALGDTYATDDELAGAVETINGTITEKVAELKKYAEDEADAAEGAAKSYTDTEIADFNTETVAPIAARVKAIEDAPYATTGNVATAKQEAIEAAAKDAADKSAVVLAEAQKYADEVNTTYTVAATTNALEFTVTPNHGDAQTITLVAPTVETGIMSVEAGNDIVVTPGENGKVTVAHEEFTTGTYEKNPESSDRTGDVYMMTAVTVDNGHVTGANVQSLAHALEAMTFIFDGGNSTN